MVRPAPASKPLHAQRGFTLVEMLLAAMITIFVVGAVAVALSQLSRTKNISRERFDNYLRVDAALDRIRRDVASIIRSDDLFWCRVYIDSDSILTDAGTMPRSELLVFTSRLRPIREIDYNGEGTQFESQFRVVDDMNGSVLWNRLDPVLDEYPMGGGIATPIVDGITGFLVEAYDGDAWYDEWDSDTDGIPVALRITVTAAAESSYKSLEPMLATLRTVVSLDRVPDLRVNMAPDEEDEAGADGATDQNGDEIGEGGTDAEADPNFGSSGRGGRGGDGFGPGGEGGPGGNGNFGPGGQGGRGGRGGPGGGPGGQGGSGQGGSGPVQRGPRRNVTNKGETRLVRPAPSGGSSG